MRSRRVLLVEDNPVNQLVAQACSTARRTHGARGDGEAALRLLAGAPGNVGVRPGAEDCQMPTLDGLACTPRLREIEAEQGRLRMPVVR